MNVRSVTIEAALYNTNVAINHVAVMRAVLSEMIMPCDI